MRFAASVLVCFLALSFISCGPDLKEISSLSSVMPKHVQMAEAVTSLVATELGVLSGPPTPGALVGAPCVRTKCTYHPSRSVRIQKQALGCGTIYGKLDGSSYLFVENVPGIEGCITEWGPAAFPSWPPPSGRAHLAIGQSNLQSPVTHEAPGNTLDHYEDAGQVFRHWGSAMLDFNGTTRLELEIDHWTHSIEKATGNVTSFFHSFTKKPIALRMERLWDKHPRVYDGSFVLKDETTGLESEVFLSNLSYIKDQCCHPVGGTITITPLQQGGTSTFVIRFKPEVCGSTELIDVLGRARTLKLPECAT